MHLNILMCPLQITNNIEPYHQAMETLSANPSMLKITQTGGKIFKKTHHEQHIFTSLYQSLGQKSNQK